MGLPFPFCGQLTIVISKDNAPLSHQIIISLDSMFDWVRLYVLSKRAIEKGHLKRSFKSQGSLVEVTGHSYVTLHGFITFVFQQKDPACVHIQNHIIEQSFRPPTTTRPTNNKHGTSPEEIPRTLKDQLPTLLEVYKRVVQLSGMVMVDEMDMSSYSLESELADHFTNAEWQKITVFEHNYMTFCAQSEVCDAMLNGRVSGKLAFLDYCERSNSLGQAQLSIVKTPFTNQMSLRDQ